MNRKASRAGPASTPAGGTEPFRAAIEDEIWLRAASEGDTLIPAITVAVEFGADQVDPRLLARSLAHVVASRDVLTSRFELVGGEVHCCPGTFDIKLAVAESAAAWA